MISVKEAVQRAVVFASDVYADELQKGLWARNVRLEEVERGLNSGTPAWQITLSVPKTDPITQLWAGYEYKVFTVDGTTGEVVSMKIREFAGVHD
jgi:hypothetical protein